MRRSKIESWNPLRRGGSWIAALALAAAIGNRGGD